MQNEALNEIYNNINEGKVYGYDVTNVRYPYFHTSLWLSIHGNIGWNNFGSSAEKNTKEDLEWLLRVIFETTPEEFLKNYTLKAA